jgi:hypothetical protein
MRISDIQKNKTSWPEDGAILADFRVFWIFFKGFEIMKIKVV